MNYRVFRLSPLASTRGASVSAVEGPSSSLPEGPSQTEFLRCWFEYDSQFDEPVPSGRINWNAVLGIVLVVGISAGFWAGVGWMVSALLN